MAQGDVPGIREDDGGFTLSAADGTAYRVDLSDDIFSPTNPLLASYLEGRRCCVFVSPTIDRLYGERLRSYLDRWLPANDWTITVVPSGERNKTMATVETVCGVAKSSGLDRNGVMVAIGGGTVCDVVGFAASIYARGVRLMKINTTLVGQVDVGVGVKTGVNALDAKNLLGAYHAPYASINDTLFLATLPHRHIRCGLGEIVKMAIVRDEKLFLTLAENPRVFLDDTWPGLLEQSSTAAAPGRRSSLEHGVIRTSMLLMLQELWQNLREVNLARIVDFGHTFSSVIETASGYRIAHGEAVAIDIAISSQIAQLLGKCPAADCERIIDVMTSLGLPVFDADTCQIGLMQQALLTACERRGRQLNLVVPTGIGSATFVENLEELPMAVLAEALATLADRPTAGPAQVASAQVASAVPSLTAPTASTVLRQRVTNVSRDLMRQVHRDHGGAGTINAYRAFDQANTHTRVAFVDLVTMPPGSSIGLHRHGDDEETYVILDGHGTMTVDGREFPVATHDMIVNRPYGEHGLRNDSTSVLHLLVFEIRPGLGPHQEAEPAHE